MKRLDPTPLEQRVAGLAARQRAAAAAIAAREDVEFEAAREARMDVPFGYRPEDYASDADVVYDREHAPLDEPQWLR